MRKVFEDCWLRLLYLLNHNILSQKALTLCHVTLSQSLAALSETGQLLKFEACVRAF